MIFELDSNGSVIFSDTSDSLIQNSVGANELKVKFANGQYISQYIPFIAFERADDKVSPLLPLATQGDYFVFTFNDKWLTAVAGNLKCSITLKQNGVVKKTANIVLQVIASVEEDEVNYIDDVMFNTLTANYNQADLRLNELEDQIETIPLVIDEVLTLSTSHDNIVVGYTNSIDSTSLNKTPEINERFVGLCKTSDNYVYSFTAKITEEKNDGGFYPFEFEEVVLLHNGRLDEVNLGVIEEDFNNENNEYFNAIKKEGIYNFTLKSSTTSSLLGNRISNTPYTMVVANSERTTTSGKVIKTTNQFIYVGASSQTTRTITENIEDDTVEITVTIKTNNYATTTELESKIQEIKNLIAEQIANLVNSAPETLDTLGEIAEALDNNADIVEVLNKSIVGKADKKYVDELFKTLNLYDYTYTTNPYVEGNVLYLENVSVEGNTLKIKNGSVENNTLYL